MSFDEGDPTGVAAIFQTGCRGIPVNCDGGRASTPHGSVINVGMGDGSVRSVSSSVSPTTWWWAVTPAGGEILGSNW